MVVGGSKGADLGVCIDLFSEDVSESGEEGEIDCGKGDIDPELADILVLYPALNFQMAVLKVWILHHSKGNPLSSAGWS
jgi:hypothetical protein